nr:MAG TPA: Protein of unknown function (DUF1071) [Caudoviricetes sp.]
MDNYFSKLNAINVNDKTEQKNGLTYLSWAYAWGEVKKLFPDANYTVYENPQGWNYFTDGRTCWVKTGVTVNGIEHIEYLPVMDYKNKSIPLDHVTSYDINKTIQRSLTKACARHGLGLYIYAGEDLPEGEIPAQNQKPAETNVAPQRATPEQVEHLAKCYTGENLSKLLQANNITRIEDIPYIKAALICKQLDQMGK